MTKDKARKRAVRDIAAQTDESYTRVHRRLTQDDAGAASRESTPEAAGNSEPHGGDAEITLDGNMAVAIMENERPRLFVFPDYTCGGQCTARTKRGVRCRNIVYAGGQVAGYEWFSVGTRLVSAYGPLPDYVAHQYLVQRCRVHYNEAAQAFCAPEWQHFDPVRHKELTTSPSLDNLPAVGDTAPLPELLAAAVNSDYSPAQRRQLLELLADQNPDGDDQRPAES
ncbi:hypothetical protein [Amycolatopsis sp. CA-126428]|uniref:hypothetical protein n=1 Tax=Amycolatopsis sp. CA-126428 TaxID=2073158 RepID=UPI0011B0ABD0|nr:hypothetical protein [Amycolatopsis sp. CA-126428]